MLVCITGKIGSGKSTILNQYKKLGFKTLEMDKYIHSIYKPNKIGYKLIKNKFGVEYINKKGVNRKKLGKLVFSSKKELNKLNAITLPLIKEKILSLREQKQIVFVELGIYITNEKYFKDCFNLVILVKGKEKISNQKLKKFSWNGNKLLLNWDVKLSKKTSLLFLDNTLSIDNQKTAVKNSLNFIKKFNKKIVG